MVMPIAISTSKMSMFPSYTFDLQQFSLHCKETYNVIPRPHWITTYYGGHVSQQFHAYFPHSCINLILVPPFQFIDYTML